MICDITARKQVEKAGDVSKSTSFASFKMESVVYWRGVVWPDVFRYPPHRHHWNKRTASHFRRRADCTKSLDEVIKAGHRAELLNSSSPSLQRKQLITPIVLNLNAVATTVESILPRLIGEDIQLNACPPSGHPSWWVKADPGQIDRLCMNRAVNALFTPRVKCRVTIDRTSNVDLDLLLRNSIGMSSWPSTLSWR